MAKLNTNISDGEISIKAYDVISNADVFDINIDAIPESSKKMSFRQKVIEIIFDEYAIMLYPKITQRKVFERIPDGEIVIQNPGNNSTYIETYSSTIKFLPKFEAEALKKDIEQKKNSGQYKNSIVQINNVLRVPFESCLECDDLSEFYKSSLLNDDHFWNLATSSILDAEADYIEKQANIARTNFRKEIYPDVKKFADALVVYCEIVRDLSDVYKIADHFISINQWIRKIPVNSHIMCLFNTDTEQGRNGKSERLKKEKLYMERNGFRTSELPLIFEGCNQNDFIEHLYYVDEEGFEKCDQKALKRINMNTAPSIIKRPLYVGRVTAKNEAMFFLATHNGKPLEKIVSNDRVVHCVRTTDAYYDNNKDKLTTIYEDEPSKEKGLLGQISYINLFDALVKNAVPYNKEKCRQIIIKKSSSNISLKISVELINLIESLIKEGKENTISFNRLIRMLSGSEQYKEERSKAMVKNLNIFLLENYPDYVLDKEKDNWAERRLKLYDEGFFENKKPTVLTIIERAHANSVVETTDKIIDREELKRYIYDLFDLDPDLPFEYPAGSKPKKNGIIANKEIYQRACELFVSTTQTKITNSYVDSKTGKVMKLIYEGVNIPNSIMTEGHISRFTNDNMWLMPRFLVEYDTPDGTSQEKIEEAKQDMLKLAEQWPTFRVVDSGNKSIHVLFCFDFASHPTTVDEYRFAVKVAVKQLNLPEKIGCAELDYKALLDPSRITRKPDVIRENGNVQKLISFKKNQIYVDWKAEYEKYKADLLKAKKEAEKIQILTKPIFNGRQGSSTSNIDRFIKSYMLKHGLVWVQGQRHSTAAKIAGACNLAGFTATECVSALQRLYPNDCSSDPSIVNRLDRYFDE